MNKVSPSLTTEPPNSPVLLYGIQQHAGVRKVTLECLNQLLLQYPDSSRRTASEIVAGFKDAIGDIEVVNMDDMDEAYTRLYQNIIDLPRCQGIQFRLAAITLAKLF